MRAFTTSTGEWFELQQRARIGAQALAIAAFAIAALAGCSGTNRDAGSDAGTNDATGGGDAGTNDATVHGPCALTGSMADRRMHPLPPILLPSGKVLEAGGLDTIGGHVLASAELYDPTTGAFVTTGSMKTPRLYAWWVSLPDHRVLVVGGVDDQNNPLSSAEIFDPQTGGWSPTGFMATPRVMPAARLLGTGKVLVFGGFVNITSLSHTGGFFTSSAAPTTSAELYDPATGKFTPTGSTTVPHALFAREHILLPTGDVFFAGGYSTSGLTAVGEIYSTTTGTFQAVGVLPSGPGEPFLSMLDSGIVIGLISSVSAPTLFNPLTKTFASGPPDLIGGCSVSIPLADGDVFCAGGDSSHAAMTERYQASTQTWAPSDTMTSGRSVPGLVQLPGGSVLVTGGYNTDALATAEICKP